MKNTLIEVTYMEGFEVANLQLQEKNYLLTWCPLVGSAILIKDQSNTKTAGFDFGFALMDNNLLMVDRQTQTVWNQWGDCHMLIWLVKKKSYV